MSKRTDHEIGSQYFPFECSDSIGVSEDFRELHWHDELEICRIKQGSGRYLINGVDYLFCTGDLFLIGPDDIHLCYEDKNLIMQVIMFDSSFVSGFSGSLSDHDYLRIFQTFQHTESWRHIKSSMLPPSLLDLFDQIEIEYQSQSTGYELMIKALLLQFLAQLNRIISMCPNSEKTAGINKTAALKIKAAAAYIDTHYQDLITLDTLSQITQMSIPYFSSTFKSFSGISPIEYTIRKRIVKAKELLLETDQSVLSISMACGFSSLSNFNHLFKSYTGISPSTYRKNYL